METLRDPDLLKEAKKSKLDIDPIDGPTVAKLMAGLYEIKPAFKSKLTELLIPGAEKKSNGGQRSIFCGGAAVAACPAGILRWSISSMPVSTA